MYNLPILIKQSNADTRRLTQIKIKKGQFRTSELTRSQVRKPILTKQKTLTAETQRARREAGGQENGKTRERKNVMCVSPSGATCV